MGNVWLRYQGFQMMQFWAPGPGRCAGWVVHDLGPQQETLILHKRDGVWSFSNPELGLMPNEEGDGFLPRVPDPDRYPLAYAFCRRQFASRYEALGVLSVQLAAM